MQTLYDRITGVRNDCQSWLICSPTNIVHHLFLIMNMIAILMISRKKC